MNAPATAQPQTKSYRILVCDDQPDVLEALRLLLKGQGWQTVTAESPRALLNAARADSFDLILTDLNYTRDPTPGKEGMALPGSREEQGNPVPVIVMTGGGNVDPGVEARRRGACDSGKKPGKKNRLRAPIRKRAEP